MKKRTICLLLCSALCVGYSIQNMNAANNTTVEYFNNGITVNCSIDTNTSTNTTLSKLTYTTKQKVGWLKVTDSNGKEDWLYSPDGVNISVGHFRVQGEGFFADPKTGKMIYDSWECNNKVISDIHNTIAEKDYVTVRSNYYDHDGKLVPNYKPDIANGGVQDVDGFYTYADGLTVDYKQDNSQSMVKWTAKLTQYHKPGFIRTKDSLSNEIILYTADGYNLATGVIEINNQMYYFDKYTGELTSDVYLAQGTLMQYKTAINIPASDLLHIANYNIPQEDASTQVTDTHPIKTDTPSKGMTTDGWVKELGNWKFVKNGQALKGWLNTGGTWYYLDSQTGVMKTGWVKDTKGRWYYLNGNGSLAKGWIKDGGTWYYLKPSSGVMQIGWLKEGNSWYRLNNSGAMLTGWQYFNNAWYYFNGSGSMATGWLQLGSKWYYLKNDGKMMNSNFRLNNVAYKVNASGVCTW